METFRTSDGVKLKYVVDDFADPWCEKETIVLSHAAMGSSRRFYAWIPHLAREYRVVRMDMRGHGESEAPDADRIEFDRFGCDLVELLDHLEIESAHLAGSSAGGIISQSVAIKYPNRVKTLASFAAAPGMKNGNVDHASWVSRIGKNGIAAFLRETIADRVPLDRVEPGFVQWFINEAARTNVPALAAFVPMMATIDLVPELHKVKCPVLVVAPGADPIRPVDDYLLIKKALPNCEFIVYDDLPHNITEVVPDRCAEDLKRFLSKNRRR